MDFMELVSQRRSVRAYRDIPVPLGDIKSCLEAARLAPSACNSQPWHFVVVTDSQRRRRLGELSRLPGTSMNSFVGEAPVIIAVVSTRPRITSQIGGFLKRKQFYLLDIGIATEHLCLEAAERNLGSCMVGWFDEKKTKRLLGLRRGRRVPLLVTLGYPADEWRQKSRKSLEKVVSWDR
jgi:nitroreductase